MSIFCPCFQYFGEIMLKGATFSGDLKLQEAFASLFESTGPKNLRHAVGEWPEAAGSHGCSPIWPMFDGRVDA
ncbi:hypothetical protein THTE_3874 [Thermogutta terrifontis]|uniref:Uncharacterized protein n=1 Tax=Thermogutta terrifontis TaxID=1331910 RepID=A0A286RKI0_9BACT|nr:hypothetical protein THTE_3874 [Thermogutta terrifontis]